MIRPSFFFVLIGIIAALGICWTLFPEGVGAIVIMTALTAVLLPLLARNAAEPNFVFRLFFVALLVRIVVGLLIYVFGLQDFFGGDALTYDFRGGMLADYWHGFIPEDSEYIDRIASASGSGWGMHYLVAAIYYVGGKNQLAAQAFCWVFGAAIGPVVYICAYRIYKNTRVARFAGIMTAFFPAFVIWSSQLMKDGLIIFLLVVVMIAILELQEKFRYEWLALLVFAMFGIMSLRFYIFYMVAIAVVGSFIIGLSNSPGAIIRRTGILIIMGLGLTYFGVLRSASIDIERFGSLEMLQRSRLDLAQRGESGFGQDVDVSTSEGAISAVPIGFAYLMFAPFPWQATSLRQAIALPEVMVWWLMIPMLIGGIIYTIRHRLREAFPVLLFALMLTLAYSIFQGNVGTAYRQRTQIQVFLFIFVAVGWVLRRERKEDERLIAQARKAQLSARQV
jgi:hypothetical protein